MQSFAYHYPRPSGRLYHCDYEPTEGPCAYVVAEPIDADEEGEPVLCGEVGYIWINYRGWHCDFHGQAAKGSLYDVHYIGERK